MEEIDYIECTYLGKICTTTPYGQVVKHLRYATKEEYEIFWGNNNEKRAKLRAKLRAYFRKVFRTKLGRVLYVQA